MLPWMSRLSLGLLPLTLAGIVTTAQAAEERSTPDDVVVDTTSQTPTSTPSSPSTPPTATTSADTNRRFACELANGEYTVMYHPESRPGQPYAWATPSTLGGGWSAERRCGEISRRLEAYRPDGLLEMRTGLENGYNTICVTTQNVPACRIVLTVPPGQNPTDTRDRVFQNLSVADSGQQTQGVNTYTGGGLESVIGQIGQALDIKMPSLEPAPIDDAINLRPFLDRADGGTGEKLGRVKSAPRLNPGRFR